jgi:hypothetical protein
MSISTFLLCRLRENYEDVRRVDLARIQGQAQRRGAAFYRSLISVKLEKSRKRLLMETNAPRS